MPCHLLEGDLEMWQVFGWMVQLSGGFRPRLYLSRQSLNQTLLFDRAWMKCFVCCLQRQLWQFVSPFFCPLSPPLLLPHLSGILLFSLLIYPKCYISITWISVQLFIQFSLLGRKMEPNTSRKQPSIKAFVSQRLWLWHFTNIWLIIYY